MAAGIRCFGVRRLDAAFFTGYTVGMNDWPHGPPHRLTEQGAYMVTCGTHEKAHLLNTAARLNMLRSLFFDCLAEAGWVLHAWALLSNHDHFIASSPADPNSLRRALSKLHTLSARELNREDDRPGRKIWFQYFDTHITFPNSYLPRLKYVHQNPVHHGISRWAEQYPWCSAAWFARSARPAFRATLDGFKIDKLSVVDAFDPQMPALSPEESGVKPPHSKWQNTPSKA